MKSDVHAPACLVAVVQSVPQNFFKTDDCGFRHNDVEK
jgi:hypothetical protein